MNTVCEQFSKSSLDYRNCRSYALDYFETRCDKYTKLQRKAGGSTRDKYRNLKRRYCAAYRALP